ncbi:MAG TPA: hypothetical protein VH281_04965 [Gaiellaceae bacterium]
MTFVGVAAARLNAYSARTEGGVSLELRDGNGFAKIRRRGAFLGHVRTGRVWATNAVHVSGYGSKVRLGPNLVRYTRRKRDDAPGLFMGIFVQSDVSWQITIRGRMISGAGGSVRGCLVLNAYDRGDRGRWRRGSKSGDWPRSRTRYELGEGSC